MGNVTAHVIVKGRVQGVFYRASTRNEARILNVDGWVRNRSDGSVEACFEGQKKDVDKMIMWCRKGPCGAYVSEVNVEWGGSEKKYQNFSVRY